MATVRIIRSHDDVSPVTCASVFNLANVVWPPAAGAEPADPQAALEQWRTQVAAQVAAHFIIGEGDKPVLAHARIFRREIFTSQGPLLVGALAMVCVHPDYRGRGWGAAVVRAAFDFLPELSTQVALFQTGVPQFYEKLGSRIIHNRFFNSDKPGNPFWDKCEMIYPAAFAWPEGDIDLNGPGY
jgi:predicted N-acetyltransferase YhbS